MNEKQFFSRRGLTVDKISSLYAQIEMIKKTPESALQV